MSSNKVTSSNKVMSSGKVMSSDKILSSPEKRSASTVMVVIAFAIVYIVWGSTYFFIRLCLQDFPPMLLGALRFVIAGVLMLVWCLFRGEQLFVWSTIRPAILSGLLLLFTGTGVLIWSEQWLASSLAAILLASGPIWFVILDRRNWAENFRSRETITGLLIGFAGVILLFGERLVHPISGGGSISAGGAAGSSGGVGLSGVTAGNGWQVIVMIVLLIGSVSWAAGSLYSKYHSSGNSNSVNAGWQMLAAGLAFVPVSLASGEMHGFHWQAVTGSSWLSLFYLVTMGSLAGYSAFVWLLQVRSATQVSTHAYVNPVVAVLLGTLFAGEKMSAMQLIGLGIILVSVLLINLAKYRKGLKAPKEQSEAEQAQDEVTGTGKAQEEVTGTGKAQDEVTGAGKAQDEVTGAGKAQDEVTGAGKALTGQIGQESGLAERAAGGKGLYGAAAGTKSAPIRP